MAGGGKGLGGRSNESEGNGGQNTSEKDRRCDLTRPLCCLRCPHPRAHRSTIARFNRTTSDRPKYLLPLPPVFDYPGARASPRSHRGTTNNEAAYPTAGKGRRHAWWCHGGHATNNVWCDAMQCETMPRCHDATMRRCTQTATHNPNRLHPFPSCKASYTECPGYTLCSLHRYICLHKNDATKHKKHENMILLKTYCKLDD